MSEAPKEGLRAPGGLTRHLPGSRGWRWTQQILCRRTGSGRRAGLCPRASRAVPADPNRAQASRAGPPRDR